MIYTIEKEPLLDGQTACRMLGITTPTLRRMRENGNIAYVQYEEGGRCRYRIEEIHRLLKDKQAVSNCVTNKTTKQ
jgi:excisionase family DNA binding protein